jgi:hypothetical protein
MRKIPSWLLCSLLLALADNGLGQADIGALHIDTGTIWVSTPDTYVVLDRMDLHYDADPSILMNNVFRFTGASVNSFRGISRPYVYAIGVSKITPGSLWLNQPVTVANRVNFEQGYFNLNGNNLFLQPAALLTNERNNNQLVGNFGGFVTIDAGLHAGITANPGNLGAIITPTTELGKMTISRGHQVQYLDSVHVSIDRWYDITPAVDATIGASVGATLRFTYFDNESEGMVPDSLVMYQSLNETPWQEIGFTTRDASQFYVEKTGLTSLDRFTLSHHSNGSTTAPPPIGTSGSILLAGAWNGSFAVINWIITSEYLDQHFDVERKYATQSDFQPIATIPTKAPGGTSSTSVNYNFIDSTVKTAPDDVTYRIHRVAANGESAYSNTITLKAQTDSSNEFIHKLYPTIAIGGRVYIEVGNMPLDKISFVVVDSKGSIVLAGELPYQSQWLPVHFLGKGVYRLVIRSKTHKWHATFIR